MENVNELIIKEGEIKVLRARQTQLEKDKLTCQLNLMRTETEYKAKLESVKQETDDNLNKVKSQLQFLEQEKADLERRLISETKKREAYESQLEIFSNNVGATQRMDGPDLSQSSRCRNVRRSANGPAFPSRCSFYGGLPTQPLNGHAQSANDSQWNNATGVVTDFVLPAPKRICLDSCADTATNTEPKLLMSRAVQTEQRKQADVVEPRYDPAWLKLTARLREIKPNGTVIRDNTNGSGPKLGDVVNEKLALCLV